MDRQVDRRDRAEVTRLSVQTIGLQAAAVEGKVEHCAQELLSRMAGVIKSVHHCASNMCDMSSTRQQQINLPVYCVKSLKLIKRGVHKPNFYQAPACS